jgi:hypothetical protein
MQRFTARIQQDDGTAGCGIELPFNPKEVFGKARAPVVATIGSHTYRTTTCSMGGSFWIPLASKHREAAGVEPGQRVAVALELDESPREVETPADLAAALSEHPDAAAAWAKLSYTHRREHVEAITGAKKPETRARRIARCLGMLSGS